MQAKAMLDSGMTAEDMVNQEFEELYPGRVQRTEIVYDVKVMVKSCSTHFCQALHLFTTVHI